MQTQHSYQSRSTYSEVGKLRVLSSHEKIRQENELNQPESTTDQKLCINIQGTKIHIYKLRFNLPTSLSFNQEGNLIRKKRASQIIISYQYVIDD